MSRHENLVSDAKKAIDRVYSDTSVSKAKTRDSLEELNIEIHDKLEALEIHKDEESGGDEE